MPNEFSVRLVPAKMAGVVSPRHSVQTNKMFVDVRRGGEKKNCSSMFVVVRRCSSLFVVGCPCGRDLFVDVRRCSSMFVDEHRRTKPTNILFVDEPKMFVCTLCLGGGGGVTGLHDVIPDDMSRVYVACHVTYQVCCVSNYFLGESQMYTHIHRVIVRSIHSLYIQLSIVHTIV